MASKLSIQFLGEAELRRKLEQMSPAQNRRILAKSLTEAAIAVARNAADKQIKRGGRVRVPGPRGGKGSLTDSPPLPHKLTSRTNTLRGSLAGRGYREGLDTSGIPRRIEVATQVKYAAVHEFGRGPYPERPFLGPALQEVSKTFRTIFLKHWRREGAFR